MRLILKRRFAFELRIPIKVFFKFRKLPLIAFCNKYHCVIKRCQRRSENTEAANLKLNTQICTSTCTINNAGRKLDFNKIGTVGQYNWNDSQKLKN